MEDIKIIEAVERYIAGTLSPDERVYFEQLRKSSPEIDQLVVEQTFFLQQLNRFDERKKFKSLLSEVHVDLAEQGVIQSPRLQGKARVVYLFRKYRRTTAIAASIAGITALTISALIWSISPTGKPINDVKLQVEDLRRIVHQQQKTNRDIYQKIDNVKEQTAQPNTPIQYTSGGTGFLIDTKGYLVTNAHVVENARNIAVQNNEGKEFRASIVHLDADRDIAILRISSDSFRSPGLIPYTLKKNATDLAESIYTLGYPRNEIVYGQGYVAARTGYNGDSLALQITIAANQGNSGGPVLNQNGEVVGILKGKQTTAEGAVFAIQSKYIYQALADMQKKDTAAQAIRLPSSSQVRKYDRMQQVKKISDFVYMVKVN